MRISKRWMFIMALALGTIAPARAYSDDLSIDANDQPQLRLSQVKPAASWSAQDDSDQIDQIDQTPPAPVTTDPALAGGATACGTGACCGPRGGVFAMVESTFFWPQFTRNLLSTGFTNSLGTQNIQSNSQLGSTDGSFLVAPRITLGLQGQCWGLMMRYWNASTWGSAFAPVPALSGGNPNTGITAFDGFKAYTLDLELQRRFCLGCWNLYGFGGVRYASVNNTRDVNIVNAFDASVLNATSFASQTFNGTGITFGLWGFSPLWDCSPFSLYFVNRYSILWGTGKAGAQSTASVGNAIGYAAEAAGALAGSTSGDLFIGEVQVGVQWMSQLRCLPACAFIRSGFEYQYWNNSQQLNAASNATAFIGGQRAFSSASAGDLLFSLVGFNIGAGLMW